MFSGIRWISQNRIFLYHFIKMFREERRRGFKPRRRYIKPACQPSATLKILHLPSKLLRKIRQDNFCTGALHAQ